MLSVGIRRRLLVGEFVRRGGVDNLVMRTLLFHQFRERLGVPEVRVFRCRMVLYEE